MTTLRTAAQQALAFTMRDFASLRDFEAAKAVLHDNLRAALAQQDEPVQEPVAKVELMTTGGNAGLATRIVETDDHLRERLRPGQLLYTAPPQQAEPAQEPVGTVRVDAGEVHIIPSIRDADLSSLKDGQAVYAAPPQRKPLTDEEIRRIIACIDKFTPVREGMRQLARAIEQAHGIGEIK